MRPASIIMFERLYLGSVGISVVSVVIGFQAIGADFAQEPGIAELGLGSGFLGAFMAIGLGISLLLWWLIAYKASNVAKWILIVLTGLGLISVPGTFLGPWDAATILSLASYALTIGAIVYLFADDAKAWFRGERSADPTAFD